MHVEPRTDQQWQPPLSCTLVEPNQGVSLNTDGFAQQAIEAAKKAIEVAPGSDHGYFILARVYVERGRFAEPSASASRR